MKREVALQSFWRTRYPNHVLVPLELTLGTAKNLANLKETDEVSLTTKKAHKMTPTKAALVPHLPRVERGSSAHQTLEINATL